MDGVRLGEVLRAQDPDASTVMMLLSSDPDVSRRAAHDAGIRSVLSSPSATPTCCAASSTPSSPTLGAAVPADDPTSVLTP